MNKQDLVKMEKDGARGLGDYQALTEFAKDCVGFDEDEWAMRALELLNKELKHDLSIHGVIMVD